MKSLKESYDTNIDIQRVDLSFLGVVQFKGIELRDHHNDTLIFVDKLSTSLLNVKKIMDNELDLGSASLQGVDFHLKTYQGDSNDNLSIFVDKFKKDSPRDSLVAPFLLNSANVYLDDFNFRLVNENKIKQVQFEAKDGGGSLSDFSIRGPNVNADIKGLYFEDERGIVITNLTTNFSYTKTKMLFQKTVLQTKTSDVYADIVFSYRREDLQFFNDKVQIKADFTKSRISLTDLNKLYHEFGNEDVLEFSGSMQGALNKFSVTDFDLISDQGFLLRGDLKFQNAVATENGFSFDAVMKESRLNYGHLTTFLPTVLGENLPPQLKRAGDFSLKGSVFLGRDNLDVDVAIFSRIGTAKANLKLTNLASNVATNYKGDLDFMNFNLGRFLNNPNLGEVTCSAAVNGAGFKIENINTGVVGVINEMEFNNYRYKGLSLNGLFQKRVFNGNLKVDDPFFKMRCNGLADFSQDINRFDFTAAILEADLVQTNLFTKDSISKLKGEVEFDIVGNTFDDVTGKTTFNAVEYTNQKGTYNFNRLVAVSAVKENIKTIQVNNNSDANGIAQGYLKGDFKFSELLKLGENALGSVYTNYNPYRVAPNQKIAYNFNLSHEIIDVFFPEIYIDNNTNISGLIDTDKNIFKLQLKSPKVVAYGNVLDSIHLQVNTQNRAYNTHLRIAKINTSYFNATKLNLINRTKNDTLFVKSEFEGIDKKGEAFNMDFFYTFNNNNKAVLGIQKSIFNFEENTWRVNPENNKANKVTFDLKKREFVFSPFKLKSREQEILLKGVVRDSTFKDLKINFKKVKLSSFLPPIDSLSMNGVLSGDLDFIQKDGQYSPVGDLSVQGFQINSFDQGDLSLKVVGENSYEKYAVALSLLNLKRKSITAAGTVDFTAQRPVIDLKFSLDKFQLNAFSPLGQDILSKIRGEASGNFDVTGFLRNPIMKGELALQNAGLKFPYLNVDYDFEGTTKIRLQDQSFIFEKLTLLDTSHATRGDFSGSITHRDFKSWYLDLNILADNLVVLDTKQSDESLYFGTAFIKGGADIVGITDNLYIDVNARTNPNTKFVIPLRDLKTIDNYKLIRFKSTEASISENKTKEEFVLNALKGLKLDIQLEVTNDALAEVVIDETNGSLLNGRGNGNLDIKIDTRNKFSMLGNFTVEKGKYEFKYGGLVNKTFEVVKGGTISWNGNPYDADLDITAIYTTKANPSILLENFNSNRKIPVNLITKISGGLFNSEQEFDIEIPNVNTSIASELEFKLNDNNIDEKTKQFLSLLALNSFYNPDQSNFNGSTALIGTTSNAITNVISDLISSDDGKVQFNVNYDIADRSNVDNIINDDLVNVEAVTQISDRVVVNGKVGVPVGSKTQSSVVGEVKVEVLLNEKGNFKGVIFNRQNEIQYSAEEEGYTQGVGLTYQVGFNSLSDLLKKIGIKKRSSTNKKVKKDSVKTAKMSKFIKLKSTNKN